MNESTQRQELVRQLNDVRDTLELAAYFFGQGDTTTTEECVAAASTRLAEILRRLIEVVEAEDEYTKIIPFPSTTKNST